MDLEPCKLVLTAGLCLLLAACARNSPDSIRLAQVEAISPNEAQTSPGRYDGNPVRWGGSIVSVENRARETRVEVLSRSLDEDGRPEARALAGARFIASLPRFVDPAEHAPGREVTLVGNIAGSTEQNIGDFPYTYPLLQAHTLHLWPEPEVDPVYYRHHPYWYDPWYHPWYDPWWRRPYR